MFVQAAILRYFWGGTENIGSLCLCTGTYRTMRISIKAFAYHEYCQRVGLDHCLAIPLRHG